MVYLFRVRDLYDLRERGVVVISDRHIADCDFKLKIGDSIEFRTPEGPTLRTTVAGIEMCDPFDSQRKFALLLPRQVSKEMVPLRAEVWKTDDQLPSVSRIP